MTAALSLFDPPAPPDPGHACPLCGHVNQPAPLDTRPRHHRNGTNTERAAANLAWPRAATNRRRILEHLAAVYPEGRTFAELETELGMFSARQRLNDLKQGGWVWPSGEQRLTPRGAPADVHVVGPAALMRLRPGALVA